MVGKLASEARDRPTVGGTKVSEAKRVCTKRMIGGGRDSSRIKIAMASRNGHDESMVAASEMELLTCAAIVFIVCAVSDPALGSLSAAGLCVERAMSPWEVSAPCTFASIVPLLFLSAVEVSA